MLQAALKYLRILDESGSPMPIASTRANVCCACKFANSNLDVYKRQGFRYGY